MTHIYQRQCGDGYWSILDNLCPNWIEGVYEGLDLEADEDNTRSVNPQCAPRALSTFLQRVLRNPQAGPVESVRNPLRVRTSQRSADARVILIARPLDVTQQLD